MVKIKIKILHFAPNNITVRSHLSFYDTDDLENFYLVPNDSKILNLINKNIILFKKIKDKKIAACYDEIKKIIYEVKPDVFITSNQLPSLFVENFLLKNVPLTYYIQHGIWSFHETERLSKTTLMARLSKFHKVYINIQNCRMLNIKYENFIPINGNTQIDYLLNNINLDDCKKRLHIEPLKKSILFVGNIKPRNFEEYPLIMNALLSFAEINNYQIYSKIKRPTIYGPNYKQNFKSIHENKNITLLDRDCLLYEYFFCDLIIIQTTGTSFLESLTLNKPTLLCQILDHTDFLNVKKYRSFPQVNSIEELEQWLKKFNENNNFFVTSTFNEDRDIILKENLGHITQHPSATTVILKTIFEDFQKISNNNNIL